MATYQDGNVRKATSNTRKAASRSAENRRCPKCKRGSALVAFSDEDAFGKACRWGDCDYADRTERTTE